MSEELRKFFEGKIDVPVGNISLAFFAGHPTEAFAVNVGLESLPSAMTVDEYVEVGGAALKLVPSWKMNEQTQVFVGERAAIIEDSEFDRSDVSKDQTGTQRSIKLITVNGKAAWTVVCAFPKEAFQQISETCDAIVRTFRILR